MIAEPTRVAIYARCSSLGQAEKDLSIPAQLEAARHRAQREGWEVVKEFVDEAETARTADRPSFQKMIADARRRPRPFEQILVWKFSRFARNREDSVIYKRLLEKHGIRLISLNEPVDDTPAGRMLEGILEVLDEFYSANMAEDVLRGMRRNAELGFHNGGSTPVGYRVKRTGDERSPRGVFEPDTTFGPIVQRVFREYLEGRGSKTIATKLNEDGIRASRGYLWTSQRILYMLRNEVYAGVRIWGKKRQKARGDDPIRITGAHEALVSREDFARVQATLRARRVVHPRRLSGGYLLSGLLVCGHCGAKFIGHSAKSGQVHYYGCPTKIKSGKTACSARLLNCRKADAAVADQLREVVLTDSHFSELVRMVNEELAGKSAAVEGELRAVEGQLADARSRLENLWEALESKRLSMDHVAERIRHWKARSDELLARKQVLLDRSAGSARMTVDKDTISAYVAGLRDLLDRGSVPERRAFLKAWIRRIEVNDRELTIVYAFPRWPGDDGETGGGGERRRQSVAGGRADRCAGPAGASAPGAMVAPPEVLSMYKNGTPGKTILELFEGVGAPVDGCRQARICCPNARLTTL